MKRLTDLMLAVTCSLVLWPLLLLIALLIYIDTGRPIFFRQERVGRNGKRFRMCKFRTMVQNAEQGSQLTADGDVRITRVGRWLRPRRLDELPQLLNVIKGEMTFVGPRPEVPRFVALYTDEQRKSLRFTPGVTDPATLSFRHEGRLLARVSDPERLYVEQIMPARLQMAVEYAERATWHSDLGLLLDTATVVFSERAADA